LAGKIQEKEANALTSGAKIRDTALIQKTANQGLISNTLSFIAHEN
jgi:hypothetical protein